MNGRASPAIVPTRGDAAHPDDGDGDRLLLTVSEAARSLGIGTTLAYELVGRGVLPHVRLGRAVRVPRAALVAWIEANTLALQCKGGNRP